ncbi:MAG: hypothetical protein QM765_20600 [Myxococcales bacterium]
MRVPYRGTVPIPLSARAMKGDCRLVTREALEAALPEHLKTTDAALAKARKEFRASLADARPQDVDGALSGARRALTGAAALVGWDDPRVASRAARIADLDRELSAEWAQVFAAAKEKATPAKEWAPVADGQLEMRVAGVRCGPALSAYAGMNLPSMRAKDACALNLAVRNKTDRTLAFDFRLLEPLSDLLLVDGRGASRDARFEGCWRSGRASDLGSSTTLEPGKEAELVVAPDLGDGILKRSRLPLLLRGTHSANVTSLKPSAVELPGGEVALEVVDYRCGESVAPLAEAAFVPSWKRPVCGLHLRLRNRTGSPKPFKSLELRDLAVLGSSSRKVSSLGDVVLEAKPRSTRQDEVLPASGKIDLMLLFEQKEAPASLDALRLVLPRAKGYFFFRVEGS